MKYKITVCENFQTIETVREFPDDLDPKKINDNLTATIKNLRQVIVNATDDVEKKKSEKGNKKEVSTTARKQRMATEAQKDYLRGLGVAVPENLTFDEARQLLNELGA